MISCLLTHEWYLDIKKFVLLSFLLVSCLFCDDQADPKLRAWFFNPDVAELDIEDWKHPTSEDYLKVQRCSKASRDRILSRPQNERPFHNDYLNKEFHGWATYRMGRLVLAHQDYSPERCVEYLGNSPEQREQCVICYAGYVKQGAPRRDYRRGIRQIKEALEHFGFKGHFIYYIGGWPGAERERLKWADVPYAFKPFMFEEARDLGYKQILWMDSCVLPVKKLDPLFTHMKEHGLCFHGAQYYPRWYEMTDGYQTILPMLKMSPRNKYEAIVTQVLGFDTRSKVANRVLDYWIRMAEEKVPFLQSDEPPFMYLINHLKLNKHRMPARYFARLPAGSFEFKYWEANPQAIVLHQYDLINPKARLPRDIFDH